MAKASTLGDDFNDNSTDTTTRWNVVFSPAPQAERIREVNRRLEIRPRPSISGDNYQYYGSKTTYDLTDSQIRIEVVRALAQEHGTTTFLSAFIDGSNEIAMGIEDGFLFAFQEVSGVATTLATVPYDPAKHRWLRIVELSGRTHYQFSADGATFQDLAVAPDAITLTAVTIAFGAGTFEAVASPGFAVLDNFNIPHVSEDRRVEERRLSARDIRIQAAEIAAERVWEEHVNNNDEVNYTDLPFVGNFSKSYRHDELGDPDPYSYGTVLRALESRDSVDFEEIVLASPTTAKKLTNPQSGLAFDLEGPDAQEYTMPPAPRFDSQQTAHEMGELYWMAVARDVPFINYSLQAGTSGTIIADAIDSLNTEFPAFGGTIAVTDQNVFRGVYYGEQVGPYVSQFLLKGNVDPRRLDGTGRDAKEGYLAYGAQAIDQRVLPAAPDTDFLTGFSDWLDVQNGVDKRGDDVFENAPRKFIATLRDGATFVHFDQVLNAYYNAAWYLMSEPVGDQDLAANATGRPQVDAEFPKNVGNPYDPPLTARDSKTQIGFNTFGPIHVLQAVSEVIGRAGRAVWWQKWGVHRRLRPEEYGGRVQNHLTEQRTYPLDGSIVSSFQFGAGLARYYNGGELGADKTFPSYLLPQAYPEGAPTHPAYGAGHATISGACVTILKAFFDENAGIQAPVVASDDGSELLDYGGDDAGDMNVGGELNKLAGNIAIFRNAAGVHWRSDYTESLLLGERIAIGLLQEMSLGFNEKDAYFEFHKFDGNICRIEGGRIEQFIP
jgi:hypothetical protein